MQNHTDINETRTKNNSNLNPITSKPKPKMIKLITQIPTNCTTQTHNKLSVILSTIKLFGTLQFEKEVETDDVGSGVENV